MHVLATASGETQFEVMFLACVIVGRYMWGDQSRWLPRACLSALFLLCVYAALHEWTIGFIVASPLFLYLMAMIWRERLSE